MNHGNASTEELIEAYKEYANKNEVLLPLLKELINNRTLNFEYCYWLKTAIMDINNLDEYLKYNIENLDTFDVMYSGYAKKMIEKPEDRYVNDSFLPITIIKSSMRDNPYVITIKPNEYGISEITYMLKDYITLKDANDNNQGVIMMNIKTVNPNDYDGIEVDKISIENGVLYHENYKASPNGKVIRTSVYDLTYILTRHSKVGSLYSFFTKDFMINPDIDFIDNIPSFIRKEDNRIDYIIVYEKHDVLGEYKVNYTNDNDRRVETAIEGETLYDAYTRYMIERGFFKDNKEKTK